MKPYKLILPCVFVLATSSLSFAKEPIKSVDKSGNVTYADKPVEDAVSAQKILIEPGPDPEQIEEAKKRTEKIKESADSAAQARKEAEAERLAEQEAARKKKAEDPKIIVIKEEHSGYPIYRNPPLITPPPVQPPPTQRPPWGKPDHPAYKPPREAPIDSGASRLW